MGSPAPTPCNSGLFRDQRPGEGWEWLDLPLLFHLIIRVGLLIFMRRRALRVRPSNKPLLPSLVSFPHPLNLSEHPLDLLHSIDQQTHRKLRT